MSEPLGKKGQCENCHCERRAILHRQLMGNGAEAFVWVCSVCNKRNPFGGPYFIEKDKVQAHLKPEDIELLPVIMPLFSDRCARCGARGVELHHWAPRGIFGDNECEQWPKDYLCTPCHQRWHNLVTPQLVKKP